MSSKKELTLEELIKQIDEDVDKEREELKGAAVIPSERRRVSQNPEKKGDMVLSRRPGLSASRRTQAYDDEAPIQRSLAYSNRSGRGTSIRTEEEDEGRGVVMAAARSLRNPTSRSLAVTSPSPARSGRRNEDEDDDEGVMAAAQESSLARSSSSLRSNRRSALEERERPPQPVVEPEKKKGFFSGFSSFFGSKQKETPNEDDLSGSAEKQGNRDRLGNDDS